MSASTAKILLCFCLTALIFATSAAFVFGCGAPVAADDGLPQQERDLEKRFLERVADAKKVEASEQIEELKKRAEKGAGGPAVADDAEQARQEAEQRTFRHELSLFKSITVGAQWTGPSAGIMAAEGQH